MVSNDAILGILKRCDIALEGNVISKELVLRSFLQFLAESSYREKHNNGFILHTGSICYEACAIAYATMTCLLEDHIDPREVVESLKKGDFCLYARGSKLVKCQCKSKEYDNDAQVKKIILIGPKKDEFGIPLERWNQIKPYNGKSKRLDGRGIKKISSLQNEQFYTQVLGIEKASIPNVIDNSVVFVMDRELAEKIIKKLSFVSNGQNYPLLDLLTASYFTEDEEYSFGKNAAKSEVNLKITGKVSVARNLILSRDGNKHIGLIISGNEIIGRNSSEIPELLKRKSIPYVHLLASLDSTNILALVQEAEKPEIYACSKKFLSHIPDTSNEVVVENVYTQELHRQISLVKDHQINKHIVEGLLSWDEYKIFKKNIFFVKINASDSEEKENFIVNAYSLMKLFLTAVFDIELFDRCVNQGIVKVENVDTRFDTLKQNAQVFPDDVREKAEEIIIVLEMLRESLLRESKKERQICDFVHLHHDKKIAIVVPKAFYITLLKETGIDKVVDSPELLTIVNANKFDNKETYDFVIAVGVMSGKRFDIFKCASSKNIEVFLYDFEAILFKHQYRRAKKAEDELNRINVNISLLPEELTSDSSDAFEKDVDEIERNEADVDEYVKQLEERTLFKRIESGKNDNLQSEVIAVGTFEDGEKIFFSKFYRAYILDKENGDVKEVDVSDIEEGDSIVFTKNDEQTHDIVDSVLKNLINERKLDQSIEIAYAHSILWKEKFRSYVEKNKISPKEMAAQMVNDEGIGVQEATILRWLDPYAHIVGPRDLESLQFIASRIGDEDLFDNAGKYFQSIRIIRKKRREILKAIGESIVDKLNGLLVPRNDIMNDFFDKIDSLTQILKLEQIVDVNRMMPINLINRPLNVEN
ncbi:MAG: DrmE family protein [Fibrobacter sp.]|nr:DrmE family protein [Fibrobacter sp.]MDY6368646.1 DrmE family protein [Fibrobacter sp.]MDY6389810.1 DrmE family protein [Fibrobacter sp.]